jgi:hypothetical protein
MSGHVASHGLRVALFSWLLSTVAAQAQCLPVVTRFPGEAVTTPQMLGTSVDIDGAGQTAVAGGPSSSGLAAVFTRNMGAWTRNSERLQPSGAVGISNFGVSVAIASDGQTIAVAGSQDNGGIGAVWVFTKTLSGWTQLGPKLVPAGNVGTGSFGSSVTLSADGATLVVGSSHDNGGSGAAYVFGRANGSYVQQGAKLVASGASGVGYLGTSVSVSHDGSSFVAGAPTDNAQLGAAYVFIRAAGTWFQNGPKIVPSESAGNCQFGRSVSMSGDASMIAVGALADRNLRGSVYVYRRSGGSYVQDGRRLEPIQTEAEFGGSLHFGTSVDLDATGSTMLVGAPDETGSSGSVYRFTRVDGLWFQRESRLRPVALGSNPRFGSSVAISNAGSNAIVGALTENSNAGAAYLLGLTPEVTITQQPATVRAAAGATARYSVGVSNNLPVTYRWRRNGIPLADGALPSGTVVFGASTPELVFAGLALGDNGVALDCVVSWPCGTSVSLPAGLAVDYDCRSDFNVDGGVDGADIEAFLIQWSTGC